MLFLYGNGFVALYIFEGKTNSRIVISNIYIFCISLDYIGPISYDFNSFCAKLIDCV